MKTPQTLPPGSWPRTWWALMAFLGFTSVAIGAFGAHGLKPYLESIGRAETFETAVRYQFYHTLALALVLLLAGQQGFSRPLRIAAGLFVTGIAVFSGSLYILCLTNTPWLGAITPLGGVFFLVGWALLGWAGWKRLSDS